MRVFRCMRRLTGFPGTRDSQRQHPVRQDPRGPGPRVLSTEDLQGETSLSSKPGLMIFCVEFWRHVVLLARGGDGLHRLAALRERRTSEEK